MKWHTDEHGRLVITVRKQEQRRLQAAQRRDETFDSDDFMHELLEPLVTNDEFTWLPDGCTRDMTAAPMVGVLGDEIPRPDNTNDALCTGLVHVGCWPHKGRLRQFYRPVLRRWAFMGYHVTSPQRELAEIGRCVWDGGDLWRTQEAAVRTVGETEAVT
jgi:hypothetical protein